MFKSYHIIISRIVIDIFCIYISVFKRYNLFISDYFLISENVYFFTVRTQFSAESACKNSQFPAAATTSWVS